MRHARSTLIGAIFAAGCNWQHTPGSVAQGNPALTAGSTLEVSGFAFSTKWGATIQRDANLAVCDALPSWPTDVERYWVRAEGVVQPNPACSAPGVTFDCPPLLVDCQFRPGALPDDVLQSDWERLRSTGILGDSPALGQRIQIRGVVSQSLGFTFVESELMRFVARCELTKASGEMVALEGTLGYRPPKLPEDPVAPELTGGESMPRVGWFTIDNCTEIEVSPG